MESVQTNPLAPSFVFLESLNAAQMRAVKHPPSIPLQILAGPGSGKTRVLTSRIAYLILAHSVPPSSICAVTFTNKAANEMKERLIKLIGAQRTSELKMGTFHALCALFLRKHADMVGIGRNFTVCDAEESKKLIANLLKPFKADLAARNMSLKEGAVLSYISKLKATSHSPKRFLTLITKESNKKKTQPAKKPLLSDILALPREIIEVVAEVYEQYEKSLRKSNSLDFDDLLVYGVKLFTKHENTVAWCRHVLVDEFQDTNVTQYRLMRALAVKNCVTVVGDPDQSIYGWRSAEIENLSNMCKDFPTTEKIVLEENYRSTEAILRVSMAIVEQDKSRIQKSLLASHPSGLTPILQTFPSEHAEATFIAGEIKRLSASTGGMLRWGDFVVLLRFNALSRAVEGALQKEGIPSRVLGGHKFFERLEIKDLLAYLQLVDNSNYNPALTRAVNVPSRGIGEKTLAELLSRADKRNISQLDVIELIHEGKFPDIKPPVKRKLDGFVKTIRTLRSLAIKGMSPADLIRQLLELVDYEQHLRKTQQDWESRWENVQELITFASEATIDVIGDHNRHRDEMSADMGTDEVESRDTPLRLFLQASMLSSEGDNQSEEDSREKVTISTCHAAKGLEWPVVIIPAVEQGTFPFYRTDDIEEERRLLYVACTRAQGLLYLSHAERRMVAGETKSKDLSEFVKAIQNTNRAIFSDRPPLLRSTDRVTLANVLGRPAPDELEVDRRLKEFNKTKRHHFECHSAENFASPRSAAIQEPLDPTSASFTTSRNLLNVPSVMVSSTTRVNTIFRPPESSKAASRPSAMSMTTPHYGRLGQELKGSMCIQAGPEAIERKTQFQATNAAQPATIAPLVSGKRRLGMGRGVVGYPNKKFKAPT